MDKKLNTFEYGNKKSLVFLKKNASDILENDDQRQSLKTELLLVD